MLSKAGMAVLLGASFVISGPVKAVNLNSSIFNEGSLLRGAAGRIFVLHNRALVPVRNLVELRKYQGQDIIDVSDDVLNSFLPAGILRGVQRLTDNETIVNDFNLVNLMGTSSPVTARANIHSFQRGNLYDVSLYLAASRLPAERNKVFEGWLVDVDTGYKLSLGAFRMDSSDRGHLDFRQTMVNFPLYDRIMITKENVSDTDPNPDTTVFLADIPGVFREVSLNAFLTGSKEVPPDNSTAVGKGYFLLDPADHTLRFDIRFHGLSSQETDAHFHGPADPGQNTDAIFTLPGGSPKTGIWHYDPSLENDILAGRVYVNIHSVNFPEGEIRGWITH